MSVELEPKFQAPAPPSKILWLRLQPSKIAHSSSGSTVLVPPQVYVFAIILHTEALSSTSPDSRLSYSSHSISAVYSGSSQNKGRYAVCKGLSAKASHFIRYDLLVLDVA